MAKLKKGLIATVFILGLQLRGNLEASQVIRGLTDLGCPEEFIGTVSDVKDLSSSLLLNEPERVKVLVEVKKVLKGSVANVVALELLKYGPLRFVKNTHYKIGLRHGWLCSSEKL